MNEKLIRQLLDVARALDLPHSAAVSLILQLLCWRKLSNEETAIPAELRFNQMLSCETREQFEALQEVQSYTCLLYTSPSPRDRQKSRMPSSA